MRSNRWLGIASALGVLLGMGNAAAQEVDVKVKVKEPREKVVVEGRGEPRERVVVEGKEREHREGGEGEERYPVSFPERPITMGGFILAPALSFTGGASRFGDDAGPHTGFAGIAIGARFGITNDFEVHASVVPIVFAPSPAGYGGLGPFVEGLGGPSFGARFRFLKGEFEMGVGADLTIFTNSITGVQIAPGIPMRLHIGKAAALDAAIVLPINAGLGLAGGGPLAKTETTVGLEVPLAFSIDITEPLHVGVSSGISVESFKDAGQTFGIPAGVFAGYAIAGKRGPLLDIDPFFRWPALLTPGTKGAGADKVDGGDFQIGVEIGGFLYL
jgi:hypothetical protein